PSSLIAAYLIEHPTSCEKHKPTAFNKIFHSTLQKEKIICCIGAKTNSSKSNRHRKTKIYSSKSNWVCFLKLKCCTLKQGNTSSEINLKFRNFDETSSVLPLCLSFHSSHR
ncbi:hypothetical protein PanWU01x14_319670, partial [Parasponia andersonii]